MVPRLSKVAAVILLVPILSYLLLPAPSFPAPPPSAVVSTEPADTESIYRRAYFSNLSRAEIMAYYKDNFRTSPLAGIPLFQYRLNHPPEEAYSLIRDQTRSSWLEQLVHPWRESLLINGFYPTKPTEQLSVGGVPYQNKITLHYFPSHPSTRITVLLLSLISTYLLIKEVRSA